MGIGCDDAKLWWVVQPAKAHEGDDVAVVADFAHELELAHNLTLRSREAVSSDAIAQHLHGDVCELPARLVHDTVASLLATRA